MLTFAQKLKLSKQKILLADDAAMLSLIVPYLHDMGAETIYRATDGDAALEYLSQSRYRIDIVICDWALPKRSGLEVLQFVRQKFGKKPFLMLASLVTQEALLAAAQHGVNGYIAKPFTVQQLEKRIVPLIDIIPDSGADESAAPAVPEMAPPEAGEDSEDDNWLI